MLQDKLCNGTRRTAAAVVWSIKSSGSMWSSAWLNEPMRRSDSASRTP